MIKEDTLYNILEESIFLIPVVSTMQRIFASIIYKNILG